jgi:hypothetical protein
MLDLALKCRSTTPAAGIVGEAVDGELEDEREHVTECPTCGQLIDLRDFGQVLHHHDRDHRPIPSH